MVILKLYEILWLQFSWISDNLSVGFLYQGMHPLDFSFDFSLNEPEYSNRKSN